MRFLIISNLFPPAFIGGYEIGCSWVVDELRGRGHEVKVAYCFEFWCLDHYKPAVYRHEQPEDAIDLGIEWILPITNKTMRHVAAYRAISTGLRHFGDRITAFEKSIAVFSPHIILHFNPLGIAMPTLAIALRYCQRNHVVSALYVSDNWLTGWPHIHPLHKLPPQVPLSKALIQPTRHGRVKRVRWREKRIRAQDFSFLLDPAERLFDLAFACSAYIKGISQSRLSSFTRMTVAPWGLPDVAEMEPLSAGAYRTSQSLNLVYIGQIEDHKGLLTVIETLPSIDARVNLTVLGDDRTAYASQCKAQAEQSGVADRVSFLGKVDHTTAIQAMKQWGQILIVPSLWAEPFSIVLLQGLALGMAVIASNTGGTKEVIIDGENGFLFPAGDTVALGGIITRLVDDRDLCVRVGQAARATVKKRYRIEHLVDHIESETVKELVLVRLHQPPEPRGLAGNRAFRGADNFTAAPSEGGERPWPSWKRLTHWRGI